MDNALSPNVCILSKSRDLPVNDIHFMFIFILLWAFSGTSNDATADAIHSWCTLSHKSFYTWSILIHRDVLGLFSVSVSSLRLFPSSLRKPPTSGRIDAVTTSAKTSTTDCFTETTWLKEKLK